MSTSSEGGLDWMAIGREIRLARLELRMNQTELAEAAGLDRKSISNYENGRPPATGRVPDGYYKVGRAIGWEPWYVDRLLGIKQPSEPTAPAPRTADQPPTPPFHGATPAELFPGVGRFARAAVAAGGDPRLRDLLEDVADRLLQSVPARAAAAAAPQQSSYGLAAYRPHAWAEGDAGVPEDDAERIRQALEEHARGKDE